MKDGFRTALKQMSNAAENLGIESNDFAKYPNERDRELLARAKSLLFQLRHALESGRSYPVTGRAQEFDHILTNPEAS